jgi:DNA modification methylase
MRGEHLLGGTSSSSSAMALAGGFEDSANGQSGTSIFDPVLCELAYAWFCPPGGLILDPFAGGSVRGIVAAQMGRRYVGIDLRPEQVDANETQARSICGELRPAWRVGDSRDLPEDISGADLIFSCPPYGNLEVYSDDPRDLSTMSYAKFFGAYQEVIAGAVERLRDNRFAVFVVGDFRAQDAQGFYRNFVADTTEAFGRAGARLYNEAILITAVGSLPLRVGKQFEAMRKLGKTHQNILVYCKGDPRKATASVGPVLLEQGAA